MKQNPESEAQIMDSTPISEIEPIEGGGITPTDRKDLDQLVEFPVLEACRILYDKNIPTIMSGANKKNVPGEAHIIIAYDMLSPQNKIIAEKFSTPFVYTGFRKRTFLSLVVPITIKSTVGEIKTAMEDIANQFESQ